MLRSPEEAIDYYIDQHLEIKLLPRLNSIICEILSQLRHKATICQTRSYT